MESGVFILGASNNQIYDNSEYSSLESSDIKYDKNLIRRDVVSYMSNMRGEAEDYHFIRILSSIMTVPEGKYFVNQEF